MNKKAQSMPINNTVLLVIAALVIVGVLIAMIRFDLITLTKEKIPGPLELEPDVEIEVNSFCPIKFGILGTKEGQPKTSLYFALKNETRYEKTNFYFISKEKEPTLYWADGAWLSGDKFLGKVVDTVDKAGNSIHQFRVYCNIDKRHGKEITNYDILKNLHGAFFKTGLSESSYLIVCRETEENSDLESCIEGEDLLSGIKKAVLSDYLLSLKRKNLEIIRLKQSVPVSSLNFKLSFDVETGWTPQFGYDIDYFSNEDSPLLHYTRNLRFSWDQCKDMPIAISSITKNAPAKDPSVKLIGVSRFYPDKDFASKELVFPDLFNDNDLDGDKCRSDLLINMNAVLSGVEDEDKFLSNLLFFTEFFCNYKPPIARSRDCAWGGQEALWNGSLKQGSCNGFNNLPNKEAKLDYLRSTMGYSDLGSCPNEPVYECMFENGGWQDCEFNTLAGSFCNLMGDSCMGFNWGDKLEFIKSFTGTKYSINLQVP